MNRLKKEGSSSKTLNEVDKLEKKVVEVALLAENKETPTKI